VDKVSEPYRLLHTDSKFGTFMCRSPTVFWRGRFLSDVMLEERTRISMLLGTRVQPILRHRDESLFSGLRRDCDLGRGAWRRDNSRVRD